MEIEFVLIPAGTFMMGSETSYDDEKPIHEVHITKPFEMGKYEVTQAQWKAVMGDNPSYFTGDDRPVEQVSWNDCQTFIQTLNAKKDDYVYRLPTEAEWEYACRAGTTGDYAGVLNDMAWYYNNFGNQTHPVGQKQPNAWGLYDMHGNVWEWCQDWYGAYPSGTVTDPTGPTSGSYRVVRGGSWYSHRHVARCSCRGRLYPVVRGSNVGFRLSRTAKP